VLSDICCFLGIASLLVFEPMALIPYWLRTARIYVIFKAQEFYFKNKRKPEKSWFTWIRESVLVKLCLLFLTGMFMLSLGLFLLFHLSSDAKIEYLPSYTVYMCFMNGMCQPDDEGKIKD